MDERPPSPPDYTNPYAPPPGPPPDPPPYTPPPAPPYTAPPTFPPVPPPPPGPTGPDPIPWEKPGLDFFTALYESLRLLLASPRKGFERVAVTAVAGRALGFAVLVGWLGVLGATLWDVSLKSTMDSMLPWMADMDRSPFVEIVFAACAPIWLPIVIGIAAVFQHLFLWLVGGAKRSFVHTFRVMCYSQVSSLLGLIPACGSLLSLAWHLVLTVKGLSAVHGISTGKAIFAVVLPLVLCCGCGGFLLLFFGAAWLAAIKAHM